MNRVVTAFSIAITLLAITACTPPSTTRTGNALAIKGTPMPSTVLLFISSDCAVSNAYQPELERLRAKYEPLGFSFVGVYAEVPINAEEVRAHVRQFGVQYPVIIDADKSLRQRYGVMLVPEVVIVQGQDFANAVPLYAGRIDNWYPESGARRAAATEHDLERALDQLLAGASPTPPTTDPIGCPLPQ